MGFLDGGLMCFSVEEEGLGLWLVEGVRTG